MFDELRASVAKMHNLHDQQIESVTARLQDHKEAHAEEVHKLENRIQILQAEIQQLTDSVVREKQRAQNAQDVFEEKL